MNPVRSKEDRYKWNVDVAYGMADEYGYEVIKHTDTHLSLIHPSKGRFEFWPTTGKGGWFKGKRMYGKAFKIDDIEAFIIKYLNPNQSKQHESDKSRADRYEKVIRHILDLPNPLCHKTHIRWVREAKRLCHDSITPKTGSDE